MSTPKLMSFDRDAPIGAETERALVMGVRAGDIAAFEQLFRAYNRQLYRFALSILHSPDEAEDVIQGVFVSIWEHRVTWSVYSSLRVYLFTAVRNRALQQLRGVRTRDRLQGDVLTFQSRFIAETRLVPDAELQHNDFAAALDRAVLALPPRTREAFLLTREHGLTYEQAAVAMGVSPKTIMTHIGRALATLRKAVGPFLAFFLATR